MTNRFLTFVLISYCTLGCGVIKTLDPGGEQFERQVINCAKDTLFIIENKSVTASAIFTIEGQLSHDAKLYWAENLVDSQNPSAATRQIPLPAGGVKVTNKQEYYSKKLYVTYKSTNDSTSGNLRIRVEL